MFKAKLIDSPSYYRLKRNHAICSLLVGVGCLFNVILFDLPFWLLVVVISSSATAIVLGFVYLRALAKISSRRIIQIEEHQIKIIGQRSGQAALFPLNEVDKVILPGTGFNVQDEKISDAGRNLLGKARKNQLILEQDSHRNQFDFVIDSHYMLRQLNKVVELWSQHGYRVERI